MRISRLTNPAHNIGKARVEVYRTLQIELGKTIDKIQLAVSKSDRLFNENLVTYWSISMVASISEGGFIGVVLYKEVVGCSGSNLVLTRSGGSVTGLASMCVWCLFSELVLTFSVTF